MLIEKVIAEQLFRDTYRIFLYKKFFVHFAPKASLHLEISTKFQISSSGKTITGDASKTVQMIIPSHLIQKTKLLFIK
jgi:hypothetical protein